jgi:hypothetical protein
MKRKNSGSMNDLETQLKQAHYILTKSRGIYLNSSDKIILLKIVRENLNRAPEGTGFPETYGWYYVARESAVTYEILFNL